VSHVSAHEPFYEVELAIDNVLIVSCTDKLHSYIVDDPED
jgi:hypothetical protein